MKSLISTLIAFLLLCGSASAMERGVVVNNWDHYPQNWGPTPGTTVRIEHRLGIDGFDKLVADVNEAHRRHRRVLLNLDGWEAPNVNAYVRLVQRTVRRWPAIRIEVWNEPNSERFWYPNPNPHDYAVLFNTVRRVVPRARLVLAAPAPTVGWGEWYRAVLAETDPALVAVHPYADTPAASEAQVREAHAIVQRPLLVTEFGWGTNCEGSFCVSAQTQKRYLVRAFRRYASLPYVRSAYWYMQKDSTHDRCRRFDCHAGLTRANDSAKPALAAF